MVPFALLSPPYYSSSFLQVLTLASNERVPLTPSMRLMFEIGHLKAATPATISRGRIPALSTQLILDGHRKFVCTLVMCQQKTTTCIHDMDYASNGYLEHELFTLLRAKPIIAVRM